MLSYIFVLLHAAEAVLLFTYSLLLSQTGITGHSRAPLSPSPNSQCVGNYTCGISRETAARMLRHFRMNGFGGIDYLQVLDHYIDNPSATSFFIEQAVLSCISNRGLDISKEQKRKCLCFHPDHYSAVHTDPESAFFNHWAEWTVGIGSDQFDIEVEFIRVGRWWVFGGCRSNVCALLCITKPLYFYTRVIVCDCL